MGHYVYLKDKSLLEKFVPENAGQVLDIYKNYDPDGYYYVTSAGMIGMAYNTARLKEGDAPKNWTDAADPKLAAAIHRPLRDALARQFGNALQLAQVG